MIKLSILYILIIPAVVYGQNETAQLFEPILIKADIDTLLSYFSKNPYCIFEKKMTKISPLTKDIIDGKKSEGLIRDGYFIQEFLPHKSRTNRFSGTVYILTGTIVIFYRNMFPCGCKMFS